MYKLGSFVIVILPAVLKNAINECGCDEWGGAESRGNGARPVE